MGPGQGVSAACHCGTVRFRVVLAGGLSTARRCTCSYCRMRGVVAVTANLEDLEIVSGREALTEYRFNTGTARHYFCSRCGLSPAEFPPVVTRDFAIDELTRRH